MIKLKKNDKLIIIIAVAVIVVAAIGIAAYNPPDDRINNQKNTSESGIYTVDWDLGTASLTSISDFADKKTPYETTVSVGRGNLKIVTFNLSWVDDKAPLFGRFGLDTLTLKITSPDGTIYEESATSAKKTKDGNIEITVTVNGIPSTEPIEADDLYEAETKLLDYPYYNDKWVNEEFAIEVTVQVGEIRPLKKLMDKGNNFELEITYEYYNPSLIKEDTKTTGQEENSEPSDPDEPAYLGMIVNTGSMVRW